MIILFTMACQINIDFLMMCSTAGSDPWEYDFIPEPIREVKAVKAMAPLAPSPKSTPSGSESSPSDEVAKKGRSDLKNALSQESFISNALPLRNDSSKICQVYSIAFNRHNHEGSVCLLSELSTE